MSSITFNQFEVGLDLRKNASTSEPSRLRELKNAYVTGGRVLRKRPGFELVTTLEAGTVGLVSGLGVLNTFQQYGGTVVHSDTRFVARTLIHTASAAYGSALARINKAEMFNGVIYLSAGFANNANFHHYLDGANPTRVTDVNCPTSKQFIKAASRIFAPSTVGTTRYCKLETPRDWTTAGAGGDGAGYLPTGIHANGSDDALALGSYEGKLAVFFIDALQMWAVDQDDRNNAYDKTVEGLGTRYHRTPVVFAGDLLFLARSGFRSVSTQNQAQNLTDIDVGSPIDTLVQNEVNTTLEPLSLYYAGHNQYWCLYPIPGGTGTRIWLLSFSKSAKVTAWSQYELPFAVDAATNHDGDLYLRSGDNVYRFVEPGTTYADDGTPYEMRIEFPFLDFKAPGVDKYIAAMDLVVTGTVQVQFRYDPNDPSKITDPITVTGNTAGASRIPVEVTLPALAPVFTSTDDSLVQLDSMTFYYDLLG